MIAPGGTARLLFAFQPLEAREYSAALLLRLGGRGGGGRDALLTVSGRGYHPADEEAGARRACAEAARRWRRWLGFGAAPVLRLAWRPLAVSPEVLSLGPCLAHGRARALLRLDNAAAVALAFAFDLGQFQEGGAGGGALSLAPASGVIAPGEVLMVEAVFAAGGAPALFEGEVRCTAWGAGEGGSGGEREAAVPPPPQHKDDGQGGGAEEEVFAQHPPPPPPRSSTLVGRLAARLPLHASMTASSLGKSDALRRRYEAALLTLAAPRAAAADTPAGGPDAASGGGSLGGGGAPLRPPRGFVQETVVTLCGAVLTRAQAAAGAYVPPEEREAAARLAGEDEGAPAPLRAAQPAHARGPPAAELPPTAAGGEAAAEGASGGAAAYAEGLAVAGEVLEGLLLEALAHADVAAALAAPPPPPPLVYMGGGVVAEAEGAPEAVGGVSAAAAGGGGEGAAAFAEYVLGSALVGALQDAAAEGALGGGGGGGGGGAGGGE